MDERRKSDRIKVDDYLRPMGRRVKQFIQVGSRKDGTVVGHVVDFSLAGIKLLSDQAFEETKVYELRAEFPMKGGQAAMVAFDAQCKWCTRRKEDGLYEAGFYFHKLTEEEAAHLRTLFRSTV